MNVEHRHAFDREMSAARGLMATDRLDEAFAHLERAHVLGQQDVRMHVRSHWRMLVVAFARRDPKAALGQSVRIVLGALGSAVGVVPVGNTGGTDIGMFERKPVAPDLQCIMQGRANGASGNVDGSGGA